MATTSLNSLNKIVNAIDAFDEKVFKTNNNFETFFGIINSIDIKPDWDNIMAKRNEMKSGHPLPNKCNFGSTLYNLIDDFKQKYPLIEQINTDALQNIISGLNELNTTCTHSFNPTPFNFSPRPRASTTSSLASYATAASSNNQFQLIFDFDKNNQKQVILKGAQIDDDNLIELKKGTNDYYTMNENTVIQDLFNEIKINSKNYGEIMTQINVKFLKLTSTLRPTSTFATPPSFGGSTKKRKQNKRTKRKKTIKKNNIIQ